MYDGTFTGFGKVARDFLRSVNVEKVVVVGVSMGSLAAIELVSEPDDLEVVGLVLCSAVMLASSEEEIEARMRIASIATRRSPERLRGFIEWREARSQLEPPPSGPTQHDIFWIRPSTYYTQVFGAVGAQGSQRQPTHLITVPVLIMSSTADETMPIDAVRQGMSLFPNAQSVEMKEIDGADHTMVFARGPAIAREMLDFFARNGI